MGDDGKFIWQPPEDIETLLGEPVVFDSDWRTTILPEALSWDRFYKRPDGTDRRDK